VGPHPHALPALASLAPVVSNPLPLGLAIWSASLPTELLNPALSLISAHRMLIQAAKGCWPAAPSVARRWQLWGWGPAKQI